ncbi:unnamed protein product, partial [Symbiodinium sp. KB8]
MPIIEEVEDDDFIALGVLFAGYDEDATVRMVKMIPVCDMSMGDEEEYERDQLHWWYESTRSQQDWIEKLVETPITGPIIEDSNEDKVRMVNLWDDSLIEVVLDSGADTHVLPLSFYLDELGTSAYPKLKLVIRDAQGNAIHTTEQKMNITFEVRKKNGKIVCVKDSAVFGNVTQPLFAVGKLWKCGWGIEPKDSQSAYLRKGKTMVPIRFANNSTVTDLRVYRAEMRESERQSERVVRKLTVKKEIEDDLEGMKYDEGWMFLRSGKPARIDWDAKYTYDPRRDDIKAFPYRTTLLTTYEGDNVNWSEMEFFECGEEWSGREKVEITTPKHWNVVVTIMEGKPCGMEEYGKYVSPLEKDVEMTGEKQKEKSVTHQSEEEKDREDVMKELDAMESGEKKPADDEREADDKKEKERKDVEKKLPSIGESMEEKMNVGGIELTPESTLKEMRKACEILGVGKTGSKTQVWKRMKEAVATSKLKELVEISKKIDEEFSRKPEGEKRPEPPSEEERKLHELTHLPKADWCESCTATRSREDNFEVSEKKHEASSVSMDFKFTGTRDEENTKDPKDTVAISLVMVDQETKFVHVIPVPTKEATSYLVEEVCRVLMLLNSKVILRTDTEPAMISLRKKVQGIRKLKKLETEIQDVSPDAHEGLQVERWVQTVRNLSKTLVYHAETEAKVKITSECTLYPWAARHAGFLLNRFVVQKGKIPFEVLFDREYKGRLAPWGSVVLGKQLPKVKEKGEAWRKGIFVGKDMVSNMNLVSTDQGIIKCRTMRQCTPAYDAETMALAAGTPWDHTQQHLVTKTKQSKRLPPTSGLEAIADGRMLPKGPQGGNGDMDEYEPSNGPGPDEAGSDPPTSQETRNEGDDDDDAGEDPGEGDDPPSSATKRNLEGQAE